METEMSEDLDNRLSALEARVPQDAQQPWSTTQERGRLGDR